MDQQIERLKIGAAVTLIGGGSCWLLYNIWKRNYLTRITDQTRSCLQQSSVVAAQSLVLGSLPVGIVRKIGWSSVRFFYEDILFRNRYFGIVTVVSALGLAILAVTYPGKSDRITKRKLWAATCLTVGTLVAPVLNTPRDLITMSGGYMLALTTPVAISCSLATNYLFLNLFAVMSTTLSVAFAHQLGIPYVIARNHTIAGTTPILPTATISSMLLSTVISVGMLSIVHMNFFVSKVQEAQENKKKEGDLEIVDLSDDITNGLLMSGYALFVFIQILIEALKIAKKLASGNKKTRKD